MAFSTFKAGINIGDKSFFYLKDQELQERQFIGGFWNGYINHGAPSKGALKQDDNLVQLNDESIFTVAIDGNLWEYDLLTTTWINHGRPSTNVACKVVSAPMYGNTVFVTASDRKLYKYTFSSNSWSWQNMGNPVTQSFWNPYRDFQNSAAAYTLFDGKLFIIHSNGHLYELYENNGSWSWHRHGRPKEPYRVSSGGSATGAVIGGIVGGVVGSLFGPWGAVIGAGIGAAIGSAAGSIITQGKVNNYTVGAGMGGSKIFTTTKKYIHQRYWNGTNWTWFRHSKVFGVASPSSCLTAIRDGKLFVSTLNNNAPLIQEFYFSNTWNTHRHAVPSFYLLNRWRAFDLVSGPSDPFPMADTIFFKATESGGGASTARSILYLSWNGSAWIWNRF